MENYWCFVIRGAKQAGCLLAVQSMPGWMRVRRGANTGEETETKLSALVNRERRYDQGCSREMISRNCLHIGHKVKKKKNQR